MNYSGFLSVSPFQYIEFISLITSLTLYYIIYKIMLSHHEQTEYFFFSHHR
ncbi:hypothetical protein FM115_04255 [Marinilactibacillus psychrotolerans 42ea]|uniref:Uncharacterized protein n=1 Tax=Marinilactibacillus psychrotolerans 42ea TaxID=1255609 RepID=A0A1R4J7E4_9LACT|nr:hypothetical protein FM115_04255 [Marinilactibacillus psychrotolerans 42ea]